MLVVSRAESCPRCEFVWSVFSALCECIGVSAPLSRVGSMYFYVRVSRRAVSDACGANVCRAPCNLCRAQ